MTLPAPPGVHAQDTVRNSVWGAGTCPLKDRGSDQQAPRTDIPACLCCRLFLGDPAGPRSPRRGEREERLRRGEDRAGHRLSAVAAEDAPDGNHG